YPLHPPGKPERLRVEHLPDVAVPVLAVSGLRDPFGTPEELVRHLTAVRGPVSTIFVPGAHTPTDDAAVATAVVEWLQARGAALTRAGDGAADPPAPGGGS